MVDKIVQLVDANDDNIFPLSSDPNAAHITMTTTDPGEGSTLGQNEFIAVYGGDPIIMDYSTNEINTGAKWIDGSPIYKKTINFGALPNNSYKDVAHGITNLGAVVKLEGMAYKSGMWKPLPYTDAAYIVLDIMNTNVRISSSWDTSSWSAYVTLYYTKSS